MKTVANKTLIGLSDEEKWKLLYENPELLTYSVEERTKPFISKVEEFLINYYEDMGYEKPFEVAYIKVNSLIKEQKLLSKLPNEELTIDDFMLNMQITNDHRIFGRFFRKYGFALLSS